MYATAFVGNLSRSLGVSSSQSAELHSVVECSCTKQGSVDFVCRGLLEWWALVDLGTRFATGKFVVHAG